jgi:hypothetical protein
MVLSAISIATISKIYHRPFGFVVSRHVLTKYQRVSSRSRGPGVSIGDRRFAFSSEWAIVPSPLNFKKRKRIAADVCLNSVSSCVPLPVLMTVMPSTLTPISPCCECHAIEPPSLSPKCDENCQACGNHRNCATLILCLSVDCDPLVPVSDPNPRF